MKHTTLSRKTSTFIAIIASFIIVACGGSSGGGGGTTTPSPTDNFVITPELVELEEQNQEIKYTLNVANQFSDRRLVISYEATNDTAKSGQDFMATKGTATIDIGETSTTFSVRIIDDNVVEQTEQFSIILSDLKVYKRQENGEITLDNNIDLKLPTSGVAPVKIKDDDTTDLRVESYDPRSQSINEGEILIVNTLSSNPIEVINDRGESGLKLNYKLKLNGVEIVPNSDFIVLGDRIAPGARRAELRLMAKVDAFTESTESFEFSLADIDSQAVFGRADAITVISEKESIVVTDRLAVGFVAAANQEILENDTGTLTFTVGILSSDVTYDFPINLLIASLRGSSAEARDLKNLQKTVTIARGEVSVDFTLGITELVENDNIIELSEQFYLELQRGTNFDVNKLVIDPEKNRVSIKILNDDATAIKFAPDNQRSVQEGEDVTLRVLAGEVEGDLGLRYTVGGKAQAGVNYERLAGITNNGMIEIKTKIDIESEPIKTIDLELTEVSDAFKIGASNVNALSISATDSTTQVRITDISIVSITPNQIINEDNPILQIATSVTIDSEITVNLSIKNNPSKAPGEDFIANQEIAATIDSGRLSATVDFSSIIINDEIVELDETIDIVITKRGSSNKFVVNPDTKKNKVAVTLRSEDRATLNITAGDRELDIREGDDVEIVVASSKAIDIGEDLVIVYSDEEMGATRITDYSFNVATITIKKEATSGTLILESKFDSEEEATEGVKLQITAIQNTVLKTNLYNNYVSIADASVSTITISDRNTLRLVTNTVTEQAGLVEITLGLDRAVNSLTIVDYEVTADTASSIDFDATRGTVTIPANSTAGTFKIAIRDDNIVEQNETIRVNFTNLRSTNTAGQAVPIPVELLVTSDEIAIISDDTATINITTNQDLKFIETAKSITFRFQSTNPIDRDVTIDYIDIATRSGNNQAIGFVGRPATENTSLADYWVPNASITLVSGETTQDISIFIRDDSLVEADETFDIALVDDAHFRNIVKGIADNNLILNTAVNTVTILNDDTTDLRLVIVDSIAEDATITLYSTNPIGRDIMINYTTSGGRTYPASKGEDYIASGLITLRAGDQTVDSGISVISDNIVEANETFDIALVDDANFRNTSGIAANDLIVDTSTITATIFNDDEAVFTFTGQATVYEGDNGYRPTTFMLNTTSEIANYVDLGAYLRIVGGTAETSDYILIDRISLTSINNFSNNFTIYIIGDTTAENDETINLSAFLNMPQSGVMARIEDGTARLTILNDENHTKINLTTVDRFLEPRGASVTELLNFKITATTPMNNPINFTYGLSGTTTANDDYNMPSGSITLAPNATSLNIPIEIKGDRIAEQNETLIMTLSTTTSQVLFTNPKATAEIVDDSVFVSANKRAIKEDESVIFNISITPQLTTNFFFSVIPGANSSISDSDIKEILFDGNNLSDSLYSGFQFSKNKGNFTITVTSAINVDARLDDRFRIHIYSNNSAYSVFSNEVTLLDEISNLDNDSVANNLDLDDDNDGLIEIHDAIEFNNIRYNLAGTSYKDSTVANSNTTGAPTASNKAANYYCSTPAGLCGYELANNIDLNSISNWQPIATNDNRFTAILEGNDYTINNLTIDRASTNYVGLFAAIEDAKIQNLRFTNVRVKGQSKVGAVVGYASNSELLNINLIGNNDQRVGNSEVIGTSNSIAEVGALAGKFEGKVTIETRRIEAVEYINDATVIVIREATSEVYSTTELGLIRDIKSSLTVSTNSNTGSMVGGLVGYLASPLLTSASKGAVYGNSSIGGLVGNLSTHGLVQQSYATGNVTHNGANNNGRINSGGLVGVVDGFGKIIQSYATGTVSGIIQYSTGNSGGLVGLISSSAGGNVSQTYSFGDVRELSGSKHHRNFIGHFAGGIGSRAVVGNNYRKLVRNDNQYIITDYGYVITLENLKRLRLSATGWYAVPAGQNYSPYCDTNRNGTIDEVEKSVDNYAWDFGDLEQVPVLICVFEQPNTRGLNESQRNATIRRNIYDSVRQQRDDFPGGGG